MDHQYTETPYRPGVMETMSCAFRHQNIDTLYGVEPAPTEELPRVCCCGSALTYAPTVAFVRVPEPVDLTDQDGNTVVQVTRLTPGPTGVL